MLAYVYACMYCLTHPELVTSLLSLQHHHWSSLHHNDLYRPRPCHICGSLPPFLSLSLSLYLCLLSYYLSRTQPVHIHPARPLYHPVFFTLLNLSSIFFPLLCPQPSAFLLWSTALLPEREKNRAAHFAETKCTSDMTPIRHNKQTHHSMSASQSS